ncbi:ArsR family transcriptional regulator [Granulicatella balaenopterae]|uniref:ArsR family transcriptional regulator n=1 Tax=Granulicatella balaenopterae TaxID=137733 RepID=A0A1H9MCW1_9LACT|nr:metalloregulator ArsR/SmtB family transcription factor [Granulicatella balaenopterae]SER21526.1 ArsR family transcriptional regulator [Granulicatella balaenopterae]
MQESAQFFKALADDKRLRIIHLLGGGEQCACFLQKEMDLTQSGLSYHMKLLTIAGIVKARPDGRWIHYSLAEDFISNANQKIKQVLES